MASHRARGESGSRVGAGGRVRGRGSFGSRANEPTGRVMSSAHTTWSCGAPTWLTRPLRPFRRDVNVDEGDAANPEPVGAAITVDANDDDNASLLPVAAEEVTIKNTGNTARDHLANERTFLAWLRTALSSVALGLALAKFTIGWSSSVGGLLFITFGMIVLVYTGHRYFSVEGALQRGEYTLPRNGITLMLCLACTGAIACLIFVLLTPQVRWASEGWHGLAYGASTSMSMQADADAERVAL